MIAIRRILCPIDFSDFSRRALDHAVAIARSYESTITLFHVCTVAPVAVYAPGSSVLPSAVFTRDDRERLLALMREFAVAEAGSTVPIQFEIGEGSVATEILARASAMPADLLVMGTHGRSGFERLLLGSVTEKVLRKAMCPVLSVPRHGADTVPVPPVVFRDIVCAVDFSDCSMHALDYAMSLTQESGARLTIVHVIEVPADLPPDLHETVLGGPRSLQDYVAAVEEDRAARLAAAVGPLVQAGRAAKQPARSVDTVVATGKPYREILRVATERAADLVVIGIHGRGAGDLLLFGSTAQHVVRQAACPVLTLRRG